MQVSARGRGRRQPTTLLMETTALRPLATIRVRGESYPLAIDWHEKKGTVLKFGGTRNTGSDGSKVEWEMRWKPSRETEGAVQVEMRAQSTPRRDGELHLQMYFPLFQPQPWSLDAAQARHDRAEIIWSDYAKQSIGFIVNDASESDGWDEQQNIFRMTREGRLSSRFTLNFVLRFAPADTKNQARELLMPLYPQFSGDSLNPVTAVSILQPAVIAEHLLDPESHQIMGAERLYLKTPGAEEDVYYAGHPHYPMEALYALWNWGRSHPRAELARVARYGSRGIAADFQVMGNGDNPEPNKGAFWDKLSGKAYSDSSSGETHGIATNARISRAFFLLHNALDEPLLRQSALNICHWLMLKQNAIGFYDGERVEATTGGGRDGKIIPQSCSLDGAEVIRSLTLAFRATGTEVFIKMAWKIADHLMLERLSDLEEASPRALASIILAFLALNQEAENIRLRKALHLYGAWLQAMPLQPMDPSLNADGLNEGMFECAIAGLQMFALEKNISYLRYAFSTLEAVPPKAKEQSWRSLSVWLQALLALACLKKDAIVDFDNQSVKMEWREFIPDGATEKFVSITGVGSDDPITYLPLVCRQTDQLFLIVLAPPSVEAVRILKNKRRPLVRNLLTEALDSETPLQPIPGQDWANVGLFMIDPA